MIKQIHAENYGVYGARKIWHELHREGIAGGPVHRRAADARGRAARAAARQVTAHDPPGRGDRPAS